MLDSELEGVRGWSEIETDRRRREVVAFREYDVKPRDGLNVVLTLDANVQYIAEKALETLCAKHTPASACAVVVDPRTGRFHFGVMPTDSRQLPGWGRLGMMRRDVRRGRVPRFELISRLWTTEHNKIETYAWSWAYCRFLASHPTYSTGFRELGKHLGDGKFDAALERVLGSRSDVLQFEWQLAARDMVPGFDFRRAAIRFVRSAPLSPGGTMVVVAADGGWQSTGVRVEKGVNVKLVASGRFILAREPRPWISTAAGISFRYHAGLPLGRLVGVVQPDRVTSDKPPRVVSLGSQGNPVPAVE